MTRRRRTLADLGETALIRRIARRAGVPPKRTWPLGIGDDAAILRTRRGEELVLSSDVQVEGVHFRFGRETPRTIGRRALVVNLSDLAAMGAEPVGALLSLCVPATLPVATFDGFIDGFLTEARLHGCPLVGGNLSRAKDSSLTVTVVGRCPRGRALRRSGLRVGDSLYVTGVLGAAALARLRADRHGSRLTRVPRPRLEAGRALAKMGGVRACIDLSDGLASDLARLLAGTRLGAEIDPRALPAPRGFRRACRELGLDPATLLAGGGEDYELLFALASHRPDAGIEGLAERLGVRVSRIGEIVDRAGIRGLPPAGPAHHF